MITNLQNTINIQTSFHTYKAPASINDLILQNSNYQTIFNIETDEIIDNSNSDVFLEIKKGRTFKTTLKADSVANKSAVFTLPASSIPYGKAHYSAILKVIDKTSGDVFLASPVLFYVEEGSVDLCDSTNEDINWQSLSFLEFKDLISFLTKGAGSKVVSHYEEFGSTYKYKTPQEALASFVSPSDNEFAFIKDLDTNKTHEWFYHNTQWIQVTDDVGSNVNLSGYDTSAIADSKYLSNIISSDVAIGGFKIGELASLPSDGSIPSSLNQKDYFKYTGADNSQLNVKHNHYYQIDGASQRYIEISEQEYNTGFLDKKIKTNDLATKQELSGYQLDVGLHAVPKDGVGYISGFNPFSTLNLSGDRILKDFATVKDFEFVDAKFIKDNFEWLSEHLGLEPLRNTVLQTINSSSKMPMLNLTKYKDVKDGFISSIQAATTKEDLVLIYGDMIKKELSLFSAENPTQHLKTYSDKATFLSDLSNVEKGMIVQTLDDHKIYTVGDNSAIIPLDLKGNLSASELAVLSGDQFDKNAIDTKISNKNNQVNFELGDIDNDGNDEIFNSAGRKLLLSGPSGNSVPLTDLRQATTKEYVDLNDESLANRLDLIDDLFFAKNIYTGKMAGTASGDDVHFDFLTGSSEVYNEGDVLEVSISGINGIYHLEVPVTFDKTIANNVKNYIEIEDPHKTGGIIRYTIERTDSTSAGTYNYTLWEQKKTGNVDSTEELLNVNVHSTKTPVSISDDLSWKTSKADVGASYTKAESDSKYQTKGNFEEWRTVKGELPSVSDIWSRPPASAANVDKFITVTNNQIKYLSTVISGAYSWIDADAEKLKIGDLYNINDSKKTLIIKSDDSFFRGTGDDNSDTSYVQNTEKIEIINNRPSAKQKSALSVDNSGMRYINNNKTYNWETNYFVGQGILSYNFTDPKGNNLQFLLHQENRNSQKYNTITLNNRFKINDLDNDELVSKLHLKQLGLWDGNYSEWYSGNYPNGKLYKYFGKQLRTSWDYTTDKTYFETSDDGSTWTKTTHTADEIIKLLDGKFDEINGLH